MNFQNFSNIHKINWNSLSTQNRVKLLTLRITRSKDMSPTFFFSPSNYNITKYLQKLFVWLKKKKKVIDFKWSYKQWLNSANWQCLLQSRWYASIRCNMILLIEADVQKEIIPFIPSGSQIPLKLVHINLAMLICHESPVWFHSSQFIMTQYAFLPCLTPPFCLEDLYSLFLPSGAQFSVTLWIPMSDHMIW